MISTHLRDSRKFSFLALLAGCSLLLIPSESVMAQGGAPPADMAPDTIPQVQLVPSSAAARKMVLLKGVIKGQDLRVIETQVIEGFGPNRFGEADDLQIELLAADNKTVQAVGIRDPRIVHVLEDGGEMFIREEAEFQVAVPYVSGGASLRITPKQHRFLPSREAQRRGITGEALRLPVRPLDKHELVPAFQKFCAVKGADQDCTAVLKGKVPTFTPPVTPGAVRPRGVEEVEIPVIPPPEPEAGTGDRPTPAP